MALANRIDGRPSESEGPSTKRQKTNRGGRAPNHPVASSSNQSHCYAWNDGRECGEPCSHGRRHACRWCGGSHRGIECSRNGKGKGSSKGGGGQGPNNGSYGKGGGRKNNGGSFKKKRKTNSGKGTGKGSSK